MKKNLTSRDNNTIYGHRNAISQLSKMYEVCGFDKMHHAWIIAGPRGCGKATFAYNFAKCVLNAGYGDTRITENGFIYPTTSHVTKKIEGLSHPDFMLISEAIDMFNLDKTIGTITIEEIRNALRFSYMKPVDGKHRIVLIDSLDSMTLNASNAALKFLEEPPANTIVIMVLHSIGNTIQTILSRSCILKLTKLSFDDFANILVKRNGLLDESQLEFLYQIADGSVSTAEFAMEEESLIKLLHNVIENKCNAQDVASIITKNKDLVEIYASMVKTALYIRLKKYFMYDVSNMLRGLDMIGEFERLMSAYKTLHIALEPALHTIFTRI